MAGCDSAEAWLAPARAPSLSGGSEVVGCVVASIRWVKPVTHALGPGGAVAGRLLKRRWPRGKCAPALLGIQILMNAFEIPMGLHGEAGSGARSTAGSSSKWALSTERPRLQRGGAFGDTRKYGTGFRIYWPLWGRVAGRRKCWWDPGRRSS